MQCVNHPTREGVNTCCECGAWLCDECTIEAGGRLFCKKCLQRAIGGSPATREDDAPRATACHAKHHVNILLLLIFSALPGANYMYEGLIKRGLFAMTSFFVLVSVTSVLHMPLLGVLICILWFTSFFDGIHIRRKINSGVCVDDSVEDIISFVKRNKTGIIIFAAVFLVLGFFSGSGYYGYHVTPGYMARQVGGMGRFAFRELIPLALFAIGVYFLVKMFRRRGGKHVKRAEDRRARLPEDDFDERNQ